jgi:hypothetical protein
MTKHSQRGFAHILVFMVLVAGLVVGLYLIKNSTNLSPKPSISDPIAVTPIPTPSSSPLAPCGCSDIDGNGLVDISDFSKLRSCFGLNVSKQPQCKAADSNGDGVVDIVDFSCLRSQFGQAHKCFIATPSATQSQKVNKNSAPR